MAYPIKELITQNIEETLKGIQIANGYSYDLNVKRYVAVQKFVPQHLTCLIYQDGEDRVEQEQNTKDGRELRIAVDVFIQQGPDDTTPDDQYANIIEAEITAALVETYTRGGLAIDTTIDPADPWPEYGEANGFTLLIHVKYRTKYGDSYTQQA